MNPTKAFHMQNYYLLRFWIFSVSQGVTFSGFTKRIHAFILRPYFKFSFGIGQEEDLCLQKNHAEGNLEINVLLFWFKSEYVQSLSFLLSQWMSKKLGVHCRRKQKNYSLERNENKIRALKIRSKMFGSIPSDFNTKIDN